MANIHDSGYKRLFENKTIFRQFIQTFVTERWAKEVDFDTCERLDKSFISEHYKETESDIIYKVKLRGKDSYICVLLEFQSTVERFMALRVLNYMTNFYMDFLTSHKKPQMLPPLFPVVLYNGDQKWEAPVEISKLIENHSLMGEFGIQFKYFKVAENEFALDELLKIRNIVSTLFLAESHYDIDLLTPELLLLFEKEDDKQAVSIFLNWFKQLSMQGRIEKEDYKALEQTYKNTEEVHAMLITAIEKERKELFEKGIEKGIEKGMIANAIVMLKKGWPISDISEITGLSDVQLLKLKSEL